VRWIGKILPLSPLVKIILVIFNSPSFIFTGKCAIIKFGVNPFTIWAIRSNLNHFFIKILQNDEFISVGTRKMLERDFPKEGGALEGKSLPRISRPDLWCGFFFRSFPLRMKICTASISKLIPRKIHSFRNTTTTLDDSKEKVTLSYLRHSAPIISGRAINLYVLPGKL